jgi:hypothetical protein
MIDQRLRERVLDRDDVSHRVICREAQAVENGAGP